MPELSPTRTVFLETQEELRWLGEGYSFLDEKSVLLAREILAQIALYDATLEELNETAATALESLLAAVQRHGLDSLEVYPGAELAGLEPAYTVSRFLGLELRQARWPDEAVPAASQGAVPGSPEAERCSKEFLRYLRLLHEQALISGNLLRLRDEYVRTERRARALDQLIMPEMRRQLGHIDEQLEGVDQEEAGRVRQAAERQKSRSSN